MIPGKGYKCMRDEGWLFGFLFHFQENTTEINEQKIRDYEGIGWYSSDL